MMQRMVRWVSRCVRFVAGRFGGAEVRDAKLIHFPAAMNPQEEEAGYFYFRGAILDNLERYFKFVRGMKRADPEAYALYSRVGAHIIPRETCASAKVMPPWFTTGHKTPSFGAITLVGPKPYNDAQCYPTFLFFQKFDTPPWYVRTAGHVGTIFKISMIFDDDEDRRDVRAYASSFFVCLKTGGTVELLQQRDFWQDVLPSKKHGGSPIVLMRSGFRYPRDLCSFAKEWDKKKKRGAAGYASDLFCLVAGFHYEAQSDIQIRCTKNNTTAVFAVATKRTAYFFRDRDVTLNDRGTRRRIFHVVRPHHRRGKSVKMHFRGERDFNWNGYHVRISVPGLHHANLYEFSAGLHDIPKNLNIDGMSIPEMASAIQATLER